MNISSDKICKKGIEKNVPFSFSSDGLLDEQEKGTLRSFIHSQIN